MDTKINIPSACSAQGLPVPELQVRASCGLTNTSANRSSRLKTIMLPLLPKGEKPPLLALSHVYSHTTKGPVAAGPYHLHQLRTSGNEKCLAPLASRISSQRPPGGLRPAPKARPSQRFWAHLLGVRWGVKERDEVRMWSAPACAGSLQQDPGLPGPWWGPQSPRVTLASAGVMQGTDGQEEP